MIRTVEWMKHTARQAASENRIIGLVPTMGALHEGHLSLVRAAQQQCRPVVVSIFVNPAQFGPREDLDRYPRPLEADCARLESLGVEFVFAPAPAEMYPDGFRTWVQVEGISQRFEGSSRPGHFRGVATVVLKLLEIVRPQFAYFGRKDAQQARVIRRLAADLNLDPEIVVCPIVREPDGLALSSRNAYLTPDDRRAAVVLHEALRAVERKIAEGERDVAPLIVTLRKVLATEPAAAPDYVEIVDANSFEPVRLLRGQCLALLAVFLGGVRLLDNMLIEEQNGRFTCSL